MGSSVEVKLHYLYCFIYPIKMRQNSRPMLPIPDNILTLKQDHIFAFVRVTVRFDGIFKVQQAGLIVCAVIVKLTIRNKAPFFLF